MVAVWIALMPGVPPVQFDLVPLHNRLTVVPTVALLALQCVEDRLLEAGLELSVDTRLTVRAAAREAFSKLVEGAERIEELDYSPDRLQKIWLAMFELVRDGIDSSFSLRVEQWIGNYQKFLSRDMASNLATGLLRLRVDPTFRVNEIAPDLRRDLIRKTAEALVPLVVRRDVVPREHFDRIVFSFWVDAGNPVNALDEYILLVQARRVVHSVSLADDDQERKLEELLADAF